MRHGQESVLGLLGRVLRGRDNDIAHEPLPSRWVELIHHLDDKERKRSERPTVDNALRDT